MEREARNRGASVAAERAWAGWAAVVLAALVDALLPPQCAACGARIAAHGHLCGACWRRLAFIERPFCERLGIPFAVDPGGPALSPAALADPPAYDRARAAVLFDDVSRTLIHGLKYRDRHDLADMMGRLMARAGADILAGADLLVPVPLHRGRLWARRFNQSVLLAAAVAAASGHTLAPDGLARVRATRQQVGLTADQRRRNVAGAFAVADAWRGGVAGRRVVLVDDVITTGATVEGCARTLHRAGAAGVDVLAFARVAQVVEMPI